MAVFDTTHWKREHNSLDGGEIKFHYADVHEWNDEGQFSLTVKDPGEPHGSIAFFNREEALSLAHWLLSILEKYE